MMKKRMFVWYASCVLFFAALPLMAEPTVEHSPKTKQEVCICRDQKWIVGGRVSYFRPDEKRLRKIYNYGWADYQFLLGYSPYRCLNVIATVNYMQETGKTLGWRNNTKIQVIPWGLELRYRYWAWRRCEFYLGAGPRYYVLKITNQAPHMKGHVSKKGWGGTVNTGMTWTPRESFFIDVFFAYSYQKMGAPSFGNNNEGLSLKLGGLDAGGGIGWKF